MASTQTSTAIRSPQHVQHSDTTSRGPWKEFASALRVSGETIQLVSLVVDKTNA